MSTAIARNRCCCRPSREMLASWQQPYCPQCNMSSETNGRILLAPGRSASGPVGRFLRGEEAGCQREQAVWFMRQATRAYGSQVLAAPRESGPLGPEGLPAVNRICPVSPYHTSHYCSYNPPHTTSSF